MSAEPRPQPVGVPLVSLETEAALWIAPPGTSEHEPEVFAVLRGVPLFANLKERQLKKVRRILHERTYDEGEVVFREGALGAGMYIVRKGAVRIVITGPAGEERQLAELGQGQFFGEIALLDRSPRSASAVAVRPTELLGFFEPDLDSLIERDSRLGSRVLWNLARLMATRLRLMNESVRSGRPLQP